MYIKVCFFLLIAWAVSFSQNQVNISGTVQDNATNKAISGASVKLVGRNLTSTTDANGVLSISSASIVQSVPSQKLSTIRFLGGHGIFLKNGAAEDIKISLYDLSGRQQAATFSGKQQSDRGAIYQPHLNNGVYVCRVSTAKENYTITLLSSDDNIFKKNDGNHTVGTMADRTNSANLTSIKAVDSLLVTKNGYIPAKVPVDTLIIDGLKILLTDTTSASNATIVPDT
jgi:hypothetical protein